MLVLVISWNTPQAAIFFEMTALNSNMNNENLHIYADDANTSKDSIDVKRLKRIYRNVYKTPNERKSSKNLQILLTPLLFIDCLT